ncbi:hypothetical protein [Paenibacillus glufosinatiresistens]|uniref:hypothetical protein n=1 Tax=Paenibacillus glufosinatiresistens TaxID=3070657 RepID=UPI00286E314E|nr:hypothetical protein [Paenibacillus sp. YX.27]
MGSSAEAEELKEAFRSRRSAAGIEELLMRDSGLPGPRINLRMAGEFARLTALSAWRELDEAVAKWSRIGPDDAGTNEPRVILPFCAMLAAGTGLAAASPEGQRSRRELLRRGMNDERWRIREAAAMGLQLAGEADFALLRETVELWLEEANELEQRGIIAALAHPPLLRVKEQAHFALRTAESVLTRLAGREAQRRSEPERVLIQALDYAVSVLAAAEPEEGFALLERMTEAEDARIRRIAAANLGKARLAKPHAGRVKRLLEGLDRVDRAANGDGSD